MVCIISYQYVYVIISIRYSEILLIMNVTMGLRTEFPFSQGNQAFNGRNICRLVPDKPDDDFSCCGKRNNREGEPSIGD